MRALRAQRLGTPMLAHRTPYSTCLVRHRTSRRAQKTELQRSEPNGFGDVAVAPDMSGVHRTVRCTPDMSGAPRKSGLRNSPASGINFSCSAIIHRTVRCNSGATATSAPTATCDALNARAARAEVRHAHAGAPDTLQYMSGAPPDIQAGPEDRAPTVGTQRLW
jgi:hypothetical protein